MLLKKENLTFASYLHHRSSVSPVTMCLAMMLWYRNSPSYFPTSLGSITPMASCISSTLCTGFEGCHSIFLPCDPQSCDGNPCHMDYINDCLSAHANNHSPLSCYQSISWLGQKTLNWYYSLTDSSEIYHIAMGVYFTPSFILHGLLSNDFFGQSFTLTTLHKLLNFKSAKWEQEWIDTAEELVCDKFEWSYKRQDTCQDYNTIDSMQVHELLYVVIHSARYSSPGFVAQAMQCLWWPSITQGLPWKRASWMTWPVILWQTHRLWMMFSCGGMNILQCICTSHEWLWIILQFLVSPVLSSFRETSSCSLQLCLLMWSMYSAMDSSLSHIWSQLSAQFTWALVCLGSWHLGGLVMDSDALAVGSLADIEGDEEQELGEGWDKFSWILEIWMTWFQLPIDLQAQTCGAGVKVTSDKGKVWGHETQGLLLKIPRTQFHQARWHPLPLSLIWGSRGGELSLHLVSSSYVPWTTLPGYPHGLGKCHQPVQICLPLWHHWVTRHWPSPRGWHQKDKDNYMAGLSHAFNPFHCWNHTTRLWLPDHEEKTQGR